MADLSNVLDHLIAPFTAGFVTLAQLENPTLSAADLTAKVEGDLKHLLRGRLGWAIDFLWGIPAVKTELDRVIGEEVAAASHSVPGLDLNPNEMNQDGSAPLEQQGGQP